MKNKTYYLDLDYEIVVRKLIITQNSREESI